MRCGLQGRTVSRQRMRRSPPRAKPIAPRHTSMNRRDTMGCPPQTFVVIAFSSIKANRCCQAAMDPLVRAPLLTRKGVGQHPRAKIRRPQTLALQHTLRANASDGDSREPTNNDSRRRRSQPIANSDHVRLQVRSAATSSIRIPPLRTTVFTCGVCSEAGGGPAATRGHRRAINRQSDRKAEPSVLRSSAFTPVSSRLAAATTERMRSRARSEAALARRRKPNARRRFRPHPAPVVVPRSNRPARAPSPASSPARRQAPMRHPGLPRIGLSARS
ncbi:MAG: hypothetical protein JWQ73_2435 [Variovorax sp.]|nr:hypothetical protein [Variovorax sp.]